MPWVADAVNFGFSSGMPWLPLGKEHGALAVDLQERGPNSTLAFSRQCIALRRSKSALRTGRIDVVEASSQKLIFDRSDGKQKLRCTFNLSSLPTPYRPSGTRLLATGDCTNGELGAYAALIEELP